MEKYFVVGDNASEKYKTKKAMLKDLDNFMDLDGKGKIKIYSLKTTQDVKELTSDDEIGRYENGKIVYLKRA